MYQERMFNKWEDGLIHFVISVAIPLIPIHIYSSTYSRSDPYFYVLLLTVLMQFAYEFYSISSDCSLLLKIEKIIALLSLTSMIVFSFFGLMNSSSTGIKNISLSDYFFMSLFIIPIIINLIEIGICIYIDIMASRYFKNNNKKNIAKGAYKV